MNTAIIVAAGSGTRFGAEKPKQFLEILGKPVLIHTLERFENCSAIDEIILVLSVSEIENFTKILKKFKISKLIKIVEGGKSRAESVFNGLKNVAESCEIVAVHDGARPLVAVDEIANTIEKAKETGAAVLVGSVTDTIKEVSDDGKILNTIDRKKLRRALTPQCFRYEILQRAFAENEIGEIATDESFLVEKLGIEVSIVEGNAQNIKITHQEDLKIAEIFLNQSKIKNQKSKMLKVGFGNDIHRLVENRPLIIGGVLIESDFGAFGHSDADVLLHAVTDAILGALALGDIGSHFSDKDERWKGANSLIFLNETVKMMEEKGFSVVNLDSTISLEKPKLRPHIEAMRENLAKALKIVIENVSVKAKTGEKVDAVGESRAIKAEAVILLENKN